MSGRLPSRKQPLSKCVFFNNRVQRISPHRSFSYIHWQCRRLAYELLKLVHKLQPPSSSSKSKSEARVFRHPFRFRNLAKAPSRRWQCQLVRSAAAAAAAQPTDTHASAYSALSGFKEKRKSFFLLPNLPRTRYIEQGSLRIPRSSVFTRLPCKARARGGKVRFRKKHLPSGRFSFTSSHDSECAASPHLPHFSFA